MKAAVTCVLFTCSGTTDANYLLPISGSITFNGPCKNKQYIKINKIK